VIVISNDDLIAHLKALGWSIDAIVGNDNKKYVFIKDYVIPSGGMRERKCDLAFEWVTSIPYVFPSAIHTRPHLLPMDMNNNNIRTQNSGIGPEWQYWSRRLDKQHTPKNIVTHIANIFKSV
jgi:hypothetical protein